MALEKAGESWSVILSEKNDTLSVYLAGQNFFKFDLEGVEASLLLLFNYSATEFMLDEIACFCSLS